jgi:hypothetical protein
MTENNKDQEIKRLKARVKRLEAKEEDNEIVADFARLFILITGKGTLYILIFLVILWVLRTLRIINY